MRFPCTFTNHPYEYTRIKDTLETKHADIQRRFESTHRVNDALMGNTTLDPTNPDDKTAVTDTWDAMTASNEYQVASPTQQNLMTADLFRNTGIVPDGVVQTLERNFRGDAKTQVTAADMLVHLDNINPRALKTIPLRDQVRSRIIRSYVEAGLDPDMAVEKAIQQTDPTNTAQQQARTSALVNITALNIGDLRQVIDGTASSGTTIRPEDEGALLREANQLFSQHYAFSGDREISQDYALNMMANENGDTLLGGPTDDQLNATGDEFDTDSVDDISNEDLDEPDSELAMSFLPPILKFLVRAGVKQVARRVRKGKERYKKTNDGRDLVQFDEGAVDFGEIGDDLAIEIGFEAAKIRLEKGRHDYENDKGFGDVHIEARHGDQIRNIVDQDGNQMFDDVAEYVGFVADNWTEIRDSGSGRLVMVVRDKSMTASDNSQPLMILELVKAEAGDFYTVVTASPFRNRRIKKMKLLKDRSEN